MPLSRRDFLKLSAAAAGSLPLARVGLSIPDALAHGGETTLAQTIVRGAKVNEGTMGAYYRLTTGPGERHIKRKELGGASSARIVTAVSFVHFTDLQLVDAESPARVEYLDRYGDGRCEFPNDPGPNDPRSSDTESAFRAQEILILQVLETMIRRVRDVRRGPVTGAPFSFVMSTGDNIDNEQYNELRWFIDLMDGGSMITPTSGGLAYEGVQLPRWLDQEYWHPDPVEDKFKRQLGFPDYPGLLQDAVRPFKATGLGSIPWLQTFGNHDGLVQGNAPQNAAFEAIATGPLKAIGLPPGVNPCDPFFGVPWGGPARPVTADPARRFLSRSEYIAEHFRTRGKPVGHGFTKKNQLDGTAYYVRDHRPFRYIALDTTNPGGFADGSIGATQFAWLEERLTEVSSVYFDAEGRRVRTRNPDRLVVLFSHHGLEKLTNGVITPDPFHPAANDLPRVMADEIEALVHRFPNVFVWINGHTHKNLVVPRRDPSKRTPGFWDVTTAAHIDWNCQARVVEIAVRADGRISIFCTMIDHDAPSDPRGANGVRRLAAIARELAANDPQKGFESIGAGEPQDRNVELTLPGPPWMKEYARTAGSR
jgi:metallophosphoesterase (TIGR03767 family)